VDPGTEKRRIKPCDNPDLLMDSFSESSSNSDFHIEDHYSEYINSESDSGFLYCIFVRERNIANT